MDQDDCQSSAASNALCRDRWSEELGDQEFYLPDGSGQLPATAARLGTASDVDGPCVT